MMKKIKRKILNKLLSYLFNTVSEDDIIVYNRKRGLILVGGKELSNKNINNLKTEIKILKELEWWKIMENEMKYVANKVMYEKAKTVDDMIFGKAILYTIDIMNKKMDDFLNLKIYGKTHKDIAK